MLPASGVEDGFFSPDSCGAVEVEETSRRMPGRMLDREVAVEENGLNSSQERLAAVDVLPPCLDHADPGVGEMWNRLFEEVRPRGEVRVEHSQ